MNIGDLNRVGFQGSLGLTHLADLLQFLNSSRKTGELNLSRGIGGKKAKFYLIGGELSSLESGDLQGIDALVEAMGWENGNFQFVSNAPKQDRSTFDLPMPFALMEAARIRDEMNRERQERKSRRHFTSVIPSPSYSTVEHNEEVVSSESPIEQVIDNDNEYFTTSEIEQIRRHDTSIEDERRTDMVQPQRTSADVLEELLKVPGIDAVVVAGRDGFVIESAGSTARLNLDTLGAALAHAVNSVEEMGGELKIEKFQDLFIEYGRAVILCRPVGEAVAALVSPDASKLGIVRYKAKSLFEELAKFF